MNSLVKGFQPAKWLGAPGFNGHLEYRIWNCEQIISFPGRRSTDSAHTMISQSSDPCSIEYMLQSVEISQATNFTLLNVVAKEAVINRQIQNITES